MLSHSFSELKTYPHEIVIESTSSHAIVQHAGQSFLLCFEIPLYFRWWSQQTHLLRFCKHFHTSKTSLIQSAAAHISSSPAACPRESFVYFRLLRSMEIYIHSSRRSRFVYPFFVCMSVKASCKFICVWYVQQFFFFIFFFHNSWKHVEHTAGSQYKIHANYENRKNISLPIKGTVYSYSYNIVIILTE